MNGSQFAREAAGVIERGGLCKFMTYNGKGEHCWIGALHCVLFGGDAMQHYPSLAERQAHFLATDTGNAIARRLGYPDAVAYNNADPTTAEDIILLFKQTASELETGEDRR